MPEKETIERARPLDGSGAAHNLLNSKQAPGGFLHAPVDRERNPVRTRTAILDAAERLFAQKGFDATSLSEVGAAAGVSRGTPGYFFGSKEELYRAVLERCLAQVREAVRSGRERTLAKPHDPAVILAGAVGEYFDYITANPNFVRLMEWEALSGGRQLREVPDLVEHHVRRQLPSLDRVVSQRR